MVQAVPKRLRLGDLLVQTGEITAEQLSIALDEQKRSGHKLGATLVELGFITEQRILEVLASQLGLQLIDLRHYRYTPEVVSKLPEHIARRNRVILLDDNPEQPLIGMADPTDLFAYDEVCRVLGRQANVAVVREADLLAVFDNVYRRTEEIIQLARHLGQELSASDSDIDRMLRAEDVADVPVVNLLQSLFEDAVASRASDIHIEPDETVLRIRMRVDGVLQEQVMPEKRIASAVVSRLKLVAGLDIAERRLPQDGRFNISVRNKNFDVRLSTMPTQHGESVVMRLLDHDLEHFDLKKLGMPAVILERFRRQLRHPHGMILVTGPTGSGKTTTLYAALRELNSPERKIITAEDPVEYRLERINQVQVHPKIGLTFANILRAALRQDPDVILVGEMRDTETVEIGLRAAITGHLVLSTLHTNDAISTADRLLDMGAEGFLVAAALRAIIAQRLVRRVCENCAQEHIPDPQTAAWLQGVGSDPAAMRLRKGRGCPQCNNTGYRGRIGVYEYLEPNAAMLAALRQGDVHAFAEAAPHSPHFHTLLESSLDYAAQGLTTVEEVMRVVGEVEEVSGP
ncbi:MAG: ATPase, T2SS/T4P/T4SS family [Halothiobacillaceae bacterium]